MSKIRKLFNDQTRLKSVMEYFNNLSYSPAHFS